MYKVMVKQGNQGEWVEQGNSNSFADAWDYASVLRRQQPTAAVKVVGPEGEWAVT